MQLPKPIRQGMHRIYETDKGVIWIGVCLNPNVYTNPGYYISGDATRRRFASAKAAALAAYKEMA